MSVRTSSLIPLTCLILFFASAAVAQVKLPPAPDSHLVAAAALAKQLPAINGWTRSEPRLNEVASDDCTYVLATATYAQGDVRVKLTLADTGSHAGTLAILASPIVSLPDNYEGKVPPATTIKRTKIDGTPGSEMWDADKMSGEMILVVAGRFVVEVESQKADSLESLRAILKAVDLKALAALR
jgi:hypothetical protein